MSDDPTAVTPTTESRRSDDSRCRRRHHRRPFRPEPGGRAAQRRRSERARRRRRNWAVVGVSRCLRPAVRARRRVVRVGAEPARRRRRAGQPSRSSRVGAPRRPATRSSTQGVIGSSLAFQIWAKVSGQRHVPGRHLPAQRRSMGVRGRRARARARPRRGRRQRLTLLLPPGLTLQQIADRVGTVARARPRRVPPARALGRGPLEVPAGDQTSLEGLTWPDTYFVGKSQTDDRHPAHHRGRVRQARRRGEPRRRRRPTGLTPYQAVIIASLVQAEAGPSRRAQGLRRDRQPSAAAACRSRSTPRSATRRAAARRCRTTPTSRSTRRTTPTRCSGLPPTPIMTVTEPALTRRAAPGQCPLSLLRDRQGWRHPLRHHARGARAEHPGSTGCAASDGVTRSTARRGSPGSSATRSRTHARRRSSTPRSRQPGLDWVFVAFPVPRGSGCATR